MKSVYLDEPRTLAVAGYPRDALRQVQRPIDHRPATHEQGVLTLKPQPAIFEEYEIRRVYDEATET